MRIAATVLAFAGSCFAQERLYGVSRNGDISFIDTGSGERTHVGNLGVEAVTATSLGWVYVLTPAGSIAVADPGRATVVGEFELGGVPAGWTVRTLGRGGSGRTSPSGLLAILASPNPGEDDALYRFDLASMSLVLVRSTGLRGVRGVVSADSYRQLLLLTEYGGVHTLDTDTGGLVHNTTIWPANGPYTSLIEERSGTVRAAGVGLWRFQGSWEVVRWTGFDDLVGFGQAGSGAERVVVRVDYGPGHTTVHRGNPSCRIRIEAAFSNITDFCFANMRLRIDADDGAWSQNVSLPPLTTGSAPGLIAGSSVVSIAAGQFHFGIHGIYGDPRNPIGGWEAVWSTSDFRSRTVGIRTMTERFEVNPYRNSPELARPSFLDAMEEIEVTGCYADCDNSTGVGTLDVFDFLCFQNLYAQRDPFACECDTTTGPTGCDIFDIICFANHFAAGCP